MNVTPEMMKNGWINAMQTLAEGTLSPEAAAAVAQIQPIPTPASATAEVIATKVNDLIAALQASGTA